MVVMQRHSPMMEITLQICSNDDTTNAIGPVTQIHAATGLDDVLFDQDNNVAVSQDLSANNDCDATALNDAECSNDFSDNSIASILQINSATGLGFAAISQNNDATIVQNMDLLNSCGESGAGINDAICDNIDSDELHWTNISINISQ